MKQNNPFSKLPAPYTLVTTKGVENFRKKMIERNNNENDYIKQIEFLIYIKIIFHIWTIEDYKEFRKIFFNMNNKKLDTLGASIINCLETSNLEIYKELKLFSKEVDWYPSLEKVKDEKTNEYILREKEITTTDSFYIIDILVKYMNQYIHNYAVKLIQDFGNKEDVHDIIIKNKETFITDFEKKFNFLAKYQLFLDIYLKIKDNSLNKLIEYTYNIKGVENKKKANSTFWTASLEGKKAGQGQTEYKRRLIRNASIIYQKTTN